MKESPFIAVLKRELDRMVSRRIYFASCIVRGEKRSVSICGRSENE